MHETIKISSNEITHEYAPSIYATNGLDSYFEHIKASVSEAPDVSTKKGRDRVASLAAQVSRSKTAVEKPGREYLKRLKEAVRPAEQEIKRFVDACDALRDETRRPLTEWEAEQERIAAAKAAEEERLRVEAEQAAAAEALKKQIEADYELALLMNIQFDRDAADAKAEAERQQRERDEQIAKQARIDAELKAKQDLEAAAQREAALKAQAEQDRVDAANKAERDKQEAIAAEQRKQQEAEQRRLAEEKRIKDEADKRAADVMHRKTIGKSVVNGLIEHAGLSREQAIETLKALMEKKIPHTSIQY